jgi:biopolymer transport protein ExbB
MLWLFVVLAVVGFVVALERSIFLHKGKIRSGDFVSGIVNLLKKGRAAEALSLCDETPGPVAAIVKSAILNFKRPQADFQLALQATAASEIPLLERRVHTLLFLSRLAQLMGVLGALVAFRNPFMALATGRTPVVGTEVFGTAMVQGLGYLAVAVALSAIFYAFYHILSGRVRALVAEMERAAIEIQSQALANGVDAGSRAI